MSDRDQILNTISENKPDESGHFDMPVLDYISGLDLENQFIQMVSHVGGKCISQNSRVLAELIKSQYPSAQSIYSCINDIPSEGLNPEKISKPHELDSIDLAVINGIFGVAENGAIWVTEKEMDHRVLPFIAEHLVILLDHNSIVATMHDAYKDIDLNHVPYGTFISGPSKTADIEQTLVMGAQGPRSHLVILTD